MNDEDKKLVEEAYKALGVSNLTALSLALGFASSTANNWYKNGLNEKVKARIKEKLGFYSSNSTLSISTIEQTLLSNFKLLDKVDQKRIFEEIKKLAGEKLDLSHLDEE